MESTEIRMYEQLRSDFLFIGKNFVNNHVLTELKNNYAVFINSKRKLDKIKDIESLLSILEKRDIINPYNIEIINLISKKYIASTVLQEKIDQYNNSLNNATPVLHKNIYLNDNNNGSNEESQKLCLEEVLIHLSDRLGRSWRDVGRSLNLIECDINNIHKNHSDEQKQSYEVLKRSITNMFKKTNLTKYEFDIWKIKLTQALGNARRKDLQEFVENLIYKE